MEKDLCVPCLPSALVKVHPVNGCGCRVVVVYTGRVIGGRMCGMDGER